MTITALPSEDPPYWVIDICSGFQSMRPTVEPTVVSLLGSVPVMYVSVDSAASLIAGSHVYRPTVFGDLTDDSLFPPMNAIGRESQREYTPPGFSRESAKNALPVLECEEILRAACLRYLAR